MQLNERIQHNFEASIAAKQALLPQVADAIAAGARMIVDCLLKGGKIMACGNGSGAADAQYFTSLMLNRFERERPGLPAIALTADITTLSAIASDYGYDDIFARQIHGLGQAGDLLLTINHNGDENISAAVAAAHERTIRVIALNGDIDDDLSRQLQPDDVHIRCQGESPARTRELQLFLIHCLCDLTDQQLLGN
jgi:D-sedoheptulose 7-phosphate isomerase